MGLGQNGTTLSLLLKISWKHKENISDNYFAEKFVGRFCKYEPYRKENELK